MASQWCERKKKESAERQRGIWKKDPFPNDRSPEGPKKKQE